VQEIIGKDESRRASRSTSKDRQDKAEKRPLSSGYNTILEEAM